MYHLLYIMIAKMGKELEMRSKNKKGNMVRWVREDFFIPGPTVFYNNIPKVAKAFGEHLKPSQITEVLLKAIDKLTVEDRAISQAAGVLLSSFLEETGADIEDLPMIFREIYNNLPRIRDTRAKGETITALVHLAIRRINGVVDCLISTSIEANGSAAVIWKALVANPYCSLKLLKPLLKRLQDEEPNLEVTSRRHSESQMPMAATNALRLILSLPEASTVLQNKFPKLLLALTSHIYFVLGASRRGSWATSLIPDPSSPLTAVEALKNLIGCAGYLKEASILEVQRCWERLSNPESFLEGIYFLARTLFTFNKKDLRRTFRVAEDYLQSPDINKFTVGVAFFTELLFHSETSLDFVKEQKIMRRLMDWMGQANPHVKLCGIRGLGYMLQHPLPEESLDPFVSPLINCASNPDGRVAKDSIKCLQLLFQHLEAEKYSLAGCNLYPQLLTYFDDEDRELQNCSISLFGMLLKGIKEEHRNRAEDSIFRSLVPLIIHLTDYWCGENCRIVLNTIVTFLELEELPFDIFEIGQQDGLDYRYSLICKYLLRRYTHRLPEMLAQMMESLRSRTPVHRKTAALLLAYSAQYIEPDVVSAKQVEDIYMATWDLRDDINTSVSKAAVTASDELLRRCGDQMNPEIVPSEHRLSLLRNNMARH
ncbi:maestro heat-like repeat-containing protein family member 6 [Lacerta agilis]|uniref:maestro heat-like repeat-containing protein family member 6 n=1 Tax=Lacerta agilis TaxID=80427 RepID=UPI001419903F|nr:maestro heat-like repeat-containing protein family member 6 [Lacerta agilis]